ncbi:MAG: RecB-like helicase [Arcobacteraceae bacterium]|nr:RecB-like helicase [Arcobacteraceae bacterium]
MKQFLALKASAGSGKTYALTLRYISLLFLDINPNTILTLTFTNKAASEMSERIFKTLLALGDDKNILEEISNQTALDISIILSKKEKVLAKFLADELFILTLDKFINKILREFAGYLDISDDFKIENDDYDLMLYKFLLSLNSDAFHNLIDFSHTNSKKLNAIVELFESLDDKNQNFTLIDFSLEILAGIQNEIMQSAFLIKDFVLNSNLSQSAHNAVNFDDIESLLECGKTWLGKESLGEYSYFKKAKPSSDLDTYLFAIQSNLQLYFKYKEIGILNGLFTIYNHFKEFRYKYKKEKNSLQFNDITNLVYLLLEKYIDKDFLYFRLDAKYEHILIDEFQDTSIIQYKILEPLIEEILSGGSIYKTFFYVGDTKQSIYRFRGGKKELFDHVAIKFEDIIELQVLDTNYRSSKNIVAFVNNIFINLGNYEYHKQYVHSKTEGFVEVVNIDSEVDESFLFIKDKLEELFTFGINPNNIAILTYTNSDVLEIYEYLKSCFPNIKIVTDMTSKLINQKNVKATINLIKYFYFKLDIYKANFNAIMGYDIQNEITLELDIKQYDLIYVVKTIASYYNLLEENLFKFIEGLSSYKDITDFIYDIDKDETTMVNSENSGLQILTIFKSKGLEFDTVLLLDRMKNKNTDKSPLLFSYDDIALNKIYYKEKIREEFDIEYKEAIQKEKEQARDDELNVLYVALTRAENNLILFKKDKQSVYDILDYKLDGYKVGELFVKNNNSFEKSAKEIAFYQPLSLGYQDVNKKDKSENSDDIKARYFGISTHYCLEMMKTFDEKSLRFALGVAKNKYSNILNSEDFLDIENRIKDLIQNKDFINLVKNRNYVKEQPLIYENELKIIDLLIENGGGYIIIDYKTTQEKHDSHKIQVKNYMKYIKEITTCEVDGYLVYLQNHKTTIEKIIW